MAAYYAYRLRPRNKDALTIFRYGRLFQQYIVDAYLSIEQERLSYIEHNQALLRCDKFQNVKNTVLDGDMFGKNIGKRIILPSSHVGSSRYMFQNYHDAMAIYRQFGPPDLFITFTCNPQWQEMKMMFLGEQRPEDRSNITSRVFKMKLDELLHDIKDNEHFGKAIAIVYTIEFQKRRLPHVHIIVWLAADDKLKSSQQIDELISAKILDPDVDPVRYDVVTKFMMHGPCGSACSRASCMKKRLMFKDVSKSISRSNHNK